MYVAGVAEREGGKWGSQCARRAGTLASRKSAITGRPLDGRATISVRWREERRKTRRGRWTRVTG